MANIDTSKIYSEEQKTRMIDKLKNMPNKTVFMLNKQDVCPIKVRIEKTPHFIHIVDVETSTDMITVGKLYGQPTQESQYRKIVDDIEMFIVNWDLTTKCHFCDLARAQGYDD